MSAKPRVRVLSPEPVMSTLSTLLILSSASVVRSKSWPEPSRASVSKPPPPSTLRKVRSETVSVSSPAPPRIESPPPPPVSEVPGAADQDLGPIRAGGRHRHRRAAEGAAVQHIGLAGIDAAVAFPGGADDQVGKAVAVDVARR
jgi:hypothetical protein